jgi:hypothetical protein
MASIGHDDCNCATLCPGSVECALIWIYDTGVCHGYCDFKAPAARRDHGDAVAAKMALDSRIDLTMRDVSLGSVGSLIAKITDAQIFVPADRIDEQGTLYLIDVSINAAVQELELMAVERP